MIGTARFPERLKELRKSRQLSQVTLAKKISTSQSMVTKWETGKRQPTKEALVALSDCFGVTVDYLVGRTDSPLSVVGQETPFEQVTPFEKEVLQKYRELGPTEQAMVCRVLGIEHPAETRIRAKRVS